LHFGLVISILLHAAILGWTLLSFQSQRELSAPEPEAVAVAMIAPSEVTKVRQGSPTAKQQDTEAKESPKGEVAKKEAAKPKPVAAAPPPPPPPEPPATKAEQKLDPIARKLAEAPPPPPAPANPPPASAPPPAAAPDERKDAEAAQAKAKREAEQQHLADEKRKAEEQKRAEEQKKAEEQKRREEQRRQAELKKKEAEKKRKAALTKKREEEKKRREAEMAAASKFDADRIAALLNKVPNKSAPPPSTPPTEPTNAKGPALGAPEGRDRQISASEIAMLKARISSQIKQKQCWRLPAAGGGSDLPVVTVRWRLKPDGSLDGDPQVDHARGDALFRVAAEAALRAVRACAPFDLPPDKYSTWRLIIWDFDPGAML
jgi:colicin import membrane protein